MTTLPGPIGPSCPMIAWAESTHPPYKDNRYCSKIGLDANGDYYKGLFFEGKFLGEEWLISLDQPEEQGEELYPVPY